MTTKELINIIENGGLDKYSVIYDNLDLQKSRFISAITAFEEMYGEREVMILSVPGRSEICGNHTDHNGGKVLSCAINLDTLAMFLPTNDNIITIFNNI